MWHSPRHPSGPGRRYTRFELAALIEPLGLMLDALRTSRAEDVVTEPILQRMETSELVYATYELFDALMSETPHPPGGHPGYQEALVAELLDQCCGLVELELSEPMAVGRGPARRSAWRSFVALCAQRDPAGRIIYPLIEHLELVYDDENVHRCPLLTASVWQDMLLGDEGSVAAEFLWDYDWRGDDYLDRRPASQVWQVAEAAGSDLDLVHQLPKTPDSAQLARARVWLNGLVDEHEREA